MSFKGVLLILCCATLIIWTLSSEASPITRRKISLIIRNQQQDSRSTGRSQTVSVLKLVLKANDPVVFSDPAVISTVFEANDPVVISDPAVISPVFETHDPVVISPSSSHPVISVPVDGRASFVCHADEESRVVWIKKDSGSPLTVGLTIFKTDQRLSIAYNQTTQDWTLSISNIRPTDAGIYECRRNKNKGEVDVQSFQLNVENSGSFRAPISGNVTENEEKADGAETVIEGSGKGISINDDEDDDNDASGQSAFIHNFGNEEKADSEETGIEGSGKGISIDDDEDDDNDASGQSAFIHNFGNEEKADSEETVIEGSGKGISIDNDEDDDNEASGQSSFIHNFGNEHKDDDERTTTASGYSAVSSQDEKYLNGGQFDDDDESDDSSGDSAFKQDLDKYESGDKSFIVNGEGSGNNQGN